MADAVFESTKANLTTAEVLAVAQSWACHSTPPHPRLPW